jgi:hypothetical protein
MLLEAHAPGCLENYANGENFLSAYQRFARILLSFDDFPLGPETVACGHPVFINLSPLMSG